MQIYALVDDALSEQPFYQDKIYNKAKVMAIVDSCTRLEKVVDGKLVGFVLCRVADHPILDIKIAYNQLLYVTPEYRLKGIATDLFDQFKVWAKANGADQIYSGGALLTALYQKENLQKIDEVWTLTL